MEGPESRIMEWGGKVGSVQLVAAASVAVTSATSYNPHMFISTPIPFSHPPVLSMQQYARQETLVRTQRLKHSPCVQCATVRLPGCGGRSIVRIAHQSPQFHSIRTLYETCYYLSFAYLSRTYHIYVSFEGPESRIMEWGEKVGPVQFIAATSVVRALLRSLSV